MKTLKTSKTVLCCFKMRESRVNIKLLKMKKILSRFVSVVFRQYKNNEETRNNWLFI